MSCAARNSLSKGMQSNRDADRKKILKGRNMKKHERGKNGKPAYAGVISADFFSEACLFVVSKTLKDESFN